ncbi:MAG: hypothetical protein FWB73_00005 [Treponema sp.]|nr:hypothetical protein [Treponema sp.]
MLNAKEKEKKSSEALINIIDDRREALEKLGLEFESRVNALGYKCMGVHYRGTDTKDVMLVSLIVAEKDFDANRKPDGMDWAYEFKNYYDNHVFLWEDVESGSRDSEIVQD